MSPPTTNGDVDTAKDVTVEKDYWNSFYSKFNISHPSQFCVMTAIEAARERSIVEFGCGNGRDSIYFATHGYTVTGCDLSVDAIDKNSETAKVIPSLNFKVVDASSADQVGAAVDGARAGGDATGGVMVYTRFFLHSIDQTQETKFFEALSSALIAGDGLYFEFRCAEDEALDKVHGKGHYRRYIDTPVMLESLTKLGFEIVYDISGRGMAKYKAEDPFVSRIIAKKI